MLLTEKRTPYESPRVTVRPFQVIKSLGIETRQAQV